MTLISAALDRVARQVSVSTPDSWLTATEKEHVEIRDDFLLETIDEVQDRVDGPSPIGKEFELVGTGAETYNLPADFKRLMRDQMAVYETTSTRRALASVTTDGEWRHIKTIGTTGAHRYYRLGGYDGNYTISIFREPSSSVTVYVAYLSTVWMANGSGTVGSEFENADDVLLMPRKMIEAGIVKRWRERYGLDAADKRMEFESEIARYSNDTRARRVVDFGGGHSSGNPFDIPVPDFIPST